MARGVSSKTDQQRRWAGSQPAGGRRDEILGSAAMVGGTGLDTIAEQKTEKKGGRDGNGQGAATGSGAASGTARRTPAKATAGKASAPAARGKSTDKDGQLDAKDLDED